MLINNFYDFVRNKIKQLFGKTNKNNDFVSVYINNALSNLFPESFKEHIKDSDYYNDSYKKVFYELNLVDTHNLENLEKQINELVNNNNVQVTFEEYNLRDWYNLLIHLFQIIESSFDNKKILNELNFLRDNLLQIDFSNKSDFITYFCIMKKSHNDINFCKVVAIKKDGFLECGSYICKLIIN